MKNNHKNSLLSIPLPSESIDDILEKISLFIKNPHGILHIVSLNPEIFVAAEENAHFKKVLTEAQIRIIDGTYVYRLARFLGISVQARIHGVDLMERLLWYASTGRYTVMLIGGAPNIADRVVDCQKRAHPRLKIVGLQGIKDVRNPSRLEEDELFSIVAAVKPHIVFVAFGSPHQELWIEAHKEQFEGKVVMGVGGAFDYLAGAVLRAPKILRELGFEWLFRLVVQPWRITRQIKILRFFVLAIKERMNRS